MGVVLVVRTEVGVVLVGTGRFLHPPTSSPSTFACLRTSFQGRTFMGTLPLRACPELVEGGEPRRKPRKRGVFISQIFIP